MPRYGEAYQDLCDVQQMLIKLIETAESAAGAAACARELREIEAYKRELRGRPRLKAVELGNGLRHAQPTAQPAPMPIELSTEPEPTKESLKHSFSETVTAPPTPDAHDHQGRLSNIPTPHTI